MGIEPVILSLDEENDPKGGKFAKEAAAAAAKREEEGVDELLPSFLASKAVLVRTCAEEGGREEGTRGLVWLPLPGVASFTEKHLGALRFGLCVMRATTTRPPVFFCHGAHEVRASIHGFAPRQEIQREMFK